MTQRKQPQLMNGDILGGGAAKPRQCQRASVYITVHHRTPCRS